MAETTPRVGILMGSDSDWPVMKKVVDACRRFDVACEVHVMSAHRTPDDVAQYARTAHERGLQVLVAGAGMAAHLAGVVAAFTPLPVIGVPCPAKNLDGLDALLAMVQMPKGVPVATVAIGGGQNAGLLAVQILGTGDAKLREAFLAYKVELAEESRARTVPDE
ncbi:MAG: 5-(carboxyamino)imidazole ribonucleotide mutase [Myxococcota bacterium]